MQLTHLSDARAYLVRTFQGRDWPKRHWSAGKTFAHCAQTIECAMDGYPSLKPAWVRATLGRLVIGKFLRQGQMRHGLSAPVPGAPEIPESTGTAEGLDRLLAAIDRFQAHTGPLQPHLLFGQMSRDDYDRYFAMHIADHLREFDLPAG